MGEHPEKAPRVAVIDIGSNSIKLLVASRTQSGEIKTEKYATIEARLGKGITAAAPRLQELAQAEAVAAIDSLITQARIFSPREFSLVATSAVRDATNGREFAGKVRALTGLPIQILSGEEEAELIGLGLLCDPAVSSHADFEVFDLGGGSLECLSFRRRKVARAVSLPLGCVRLTEMFVTNPAERLAMAEAKTIREHVDATLRDSGFPFGETQNRLVFGTGGTLTTVRAIRAARAGRTFEQTDAEVTREEIEQQLMEIGKLELTQRKKIPGLPPARADVFPAALATLSALSDTGNFREFRTSVCNLRFGVAAKLLNRG